MKITTTSTDIYPTLTNTSTYDAFMDSLSFDKNKAIDAIYDAGYITEDEAKQLKDHSYAKRNECTSITLNDSYDKITLFCEETEDNGSYTMGINIIFKISYLKENGVIIDETK